MEGEQRHHVGQQREREGEAQAGGQAAVPQDLLHGRGQQVDVTCRETRRSEQQNHTTTTSELLLTDPQVDVVKEEAAQNLVQGPVHFESRWSSHQPLQQLLQLCGHALRNRRQR